LVFFGQKTSNPDHEHSAANSILFNLWVGHNCVQLADKTKWPTTKRRAFSTNENNI